MLFNSYDFLWFFPTAFLIYWSLRNHLKAQNTVLVALSYLFYGWCDPRFLALIVGITAIGFASGLGMSAWNNNPHARKTVRNLGIAACLFILALFKYYDFFTAELNALLLACGGNHPIPLLHWVLPVGISFYTFQVASYIADVHRRTIQPCRSAIDFAAFVSFFPQLVAGPIERASDLLPQISGKRHLTYSDMTEGFKLMLWGYVKKMWLADQCAPLVSQTFASGSPTGADLWAASFLFAFQIYGDFSGYSDIAIGAARMFGIRLTRNFNRPYFATSIPEFWRRWHISLMKWFKDYVYIPLGGSHRGKWQKCRNTCIVFLTSGLWHGANWTFVAWGLLQFIGFLPDILLNRRKERKETALHEKAQKTFIGQLKIGMQTIGVFLFICIGWVIFRSENISQACSFIHTMLTESPVAKPFCGFSSFIPAGVVLGAEWVTRKRSHTLDFKGHGLLKYRAFRWSIYYALMFITLRWGGQQSQFIYFQF